MKKSAPPTRISELDRLTLQASTDRTQRCNTQYQLHAERAEAAKEAAQVQAAKHKATVEGIFQRYALASEADSINLETGEIVRAPPKAEVKPDAAPSTAAAATAQKKES